MLPVVSAQASDACQPEPEIHAENADGSTLSVRTDCDDATGMRLYTLDYRSADGRQADSSPLPQDSESAPMGHAALPDIDQDRFHEVEIRGMCGAGPNCEGDLHRVDRRRGRLVHFFSGGYADLSVIDGHLVEAGRASCRSWKYHAYRLDDREVPGDYGNMDLMVRIGADIASEDDDAPARCTFSRRNGDNWDIVMPPNAQWLSLCRLYGDSYHLVTPEEAVAADSAATRE